MDSDLVSIPFWLASRTVCTPDELPDSRAAINEPESVAGAAQKAGAGELSASEWPISEKRRSTYNQRVSKAELSDRCVSKAWERENLRAFLYEIGQLAAASAEGKEKIIKRLNSN